MKKSILSVICIFIVIAGLQAQNKTCGSNPVYRQFDFWLGEWEAFGVNGKKAGDSKITMQLDSCIILEEWTGAGAGNYSGKSYNTYNVTTKKWQQYWVDNKGGITEYFDGHFEKDKMILQTYNLKMPNGSDKIMKMTFFNLGPKKVRQFGESSSDKGKTWKTDFDLEYRRKG
mgnify:CR=1 FL=1